MRGEGGRGREREGWRERERDRRRERERDREREGELGGVVGRKRGWEGKVGEREEKGEE